MALSSWRYASPQMDDRRPASIRDPFNGPSPNSPLSGDRTTFLSPPLGSSDQCPPPLPGLYHGSVQFSLRDGPAALRLSPVNSIRCGEHQPLVRPSSLFARARGNGGLITYPPHGFCGCSLTVPPPRWGEIKNLSLRVMQIQTESTRVDQQFRAWGRGRFLKTLGRWFDEKVRHESAYLWRAR